jgi:hypothetical protein
MFTTDNKDCDKVTWRNHYWIFWKSCIGVLSFRRKMVILYVFLGSARKAHGILFWFTLQQRNAQIYIILVYYRLWRVHLLCHPTPLADLVGKTCSTTSRWKWPIKIFLSKYPTIHSFFNPFAEDDIHCNALNDVLLTIYWLLTKLRKANKFFQFLTKDGNGNAAFLVPEKVCWGGLGVQGWYDENNYQNAPCRGRQWKG